MLIEVDRYCFVCGPENPEGLKATFTCEGGQSSGRYFAREEHQGYTGVSHGGVLAALLDEAMVYAAVSLGKWVATAEMTVRYVQPAPTGGWLNLTASVVDHRRTLVQCSAEARTDEGELIASATGKLMQGRELTEAERR